MNKLMHGMTFGSGSLTAAALSGQLRYVVIIVTIVAVTIVALRVIMIVTLWKLPRDRLDWFQGMWGPRGGGPDPGRDDGG